SIATETLLPQRITEECHRLFLIILLLREESAEERCDLECRKHTARKPGSDHMRRIANAGQFKIRLAKSTQTFEAVGIAHISLNVWSRNPRLAIASYIR